MKFFSFELIILLLIGATTLTTAGKAKNEVLVCFGDSISDIGNTFEFTEKSWPISYAYPEHAFTDEQTWLHYLKDLRDKNKDVGKVKVMNHALGGATSDNSFMQGYTGPTSTWPVTGGVQQFEMYQLATNQTEFHDPKKQQVLYFVLLGVNDVYFQWASGQDPSSSEFLESVVANLNKIVRGIIQNELSYKNNDFRVVVANAYPVEVVPFAYYYPGQLDGVTEQFNQLLAAELDSTKEEFPDVDLIEFDLSSTIYDIIEDVPATVSTNTSCVQGDYFSGDLVLCQDPSKYVYYDTFHPSSWVHEMIAKAINKLL